MYSIDCSMHLPASIREITRGWLHCTLPPSMVTFVASLELCSDCLGLELVVLWCSQSCWVLCHRDEMPKTSLTSSQLWRNIVLFAWRNSPEHRWTPFQKAYNLLWVKSHFRLQQRIFSKGFTPHQHITSVIFLGLKLFQGSNPDRCACQHGAKHRNWKYSFVGGMPSGTPGYHLLFVAGESQCRLVTWTFTTCFLLELESDVERSRCSRMQLRAAITPFCQRVHGPRMYKNLVGVLMFQISFSSLI